MIASVHTPRNRRIAVTMAAALLVVTLQMRPAGQLRSAQPAAPPTPRAAAPIDLTGTWVSVITESWRWRMVTPAKGDFAGIPLTERAFKEAQTWDPARDETAGQQCRAYGAAGLMRLPERLRISWADERTLKVEVDTGMQTRLLHFDRAPSSGPSWQGSSTAAWVRPSTGRGGPAPGGHLTVTTTNLRPGYLRKNGVPYSAKTAMTEYWDLYRENNGEQWLVITTLIDDPEYLSDRYYTSPNFKKESDDSKWNPTPCSTR